MKVVCTVGALILALSIGGQASAYIQEADLNSKVVVTERQQLLAQVDTVSLYLTSDRVGYEPELTFDRTIKVEVTVLSQDLFNDRKAMQDFVSRQISVFKRELTRRLYWAAPSIARNFNPETDLLFIINEGDRRHTVAQVGGSGWQWLNKGKATPVYSSKTSKRTKRKSETGLSEARSQGRTSCNCPALVGKK